MNNMSTPKDEKAKIFVQFLKDFKKENGYYPRSKHLVEHFGHNKTYISKLIKDMEERGYLKNVNEIRPA